MSRYDYFVKKVLDYSLNDKVYVSHSEAIMVALALDAWWKKKLLTKSVKDDPYSAWHRLDGVQKQVVDDFRRGKFGVIVLPR